MLALEIDGGVDLEAVVEQPLVAVAGHQVAADVLGHVGRRVAEDVLHGKDFDGRGVGLLARHLRNHPLLGHAPQHVRAARLGLLGMGEGRVLRRRLGKPRDQGDLRQRQLPDVLAEVVLGCRLHAIAVVAEVDLVQVEVEDLLLAEVVLEALGEDQLARLAPDARPAGAHVRGLHAFGAGENRLGGLLRQGRAALLHLVPQHVGLEEGAGDAGVADARVVEEVGVLGGDERLHHLLGDMLVGHDNAALVVELADELLVAAPDGGDDRRPVPARPVDGGEAPGEGDVHGDQRDEEDCGQDSSGDGKQDPERLLARPAVCHQAAMHAPHEVLRAVGVLGLGHHSRLQRTVEPGRVIRANCVLSGARPSPSRITLFSTGCPRE